MAITTISAAIASLGTTGGGSSTSAVDPATQAFQKADKRIARQREQTAVQISAFGRLKSGFAGVQSAAAALGDTAQGASAATIGTNAANFVNTFNTALSSARSAAAQTGAPLEANRARGAEADLRRSVGTDATAAAELRRVGIRQQADGSLGIDRQVFDAALASNPEAVRSALATLGRVVEGTATRELGTGGNIGQAVNALDGRARSLETRQAEQQALASAAQQTVTDRVTRLNATLNSGAAAYQRIFSL